MLQIHKEYVESVATVAAQRHLPHKVCIEGFLQKSAH